jgi:hypothetical protein
MTKSVAKTLFLALLAPALASAAIAGCSSDADDAGAAGAAGTSAAGSAGSAGASAAGSGGTGGAGSSGEGGSAGAAAGSGGAAGESAGGAAGASGAAGSGDAGSAGSGDAGAAGSAGSAGGAAGAGGSGGPGATFRDLTFQATGFLIHKDARFTVSLVRLKDNAVIVSGTIDKISDDTLTFNWPAVIKDGGKYALDYYVDLKGDGTCDAPPPGNPEGDHVWRKELPAALTGDTFTVAHDSMWTDQCPTFNGAKPRFNLSFKATMFTPHAGGLVVVAVTKADSGDVVARKTFSPVPADGALDVAWNGLLEQGVAYNVDYFADANMNGMCDPPPSDHVWRFPLAAVVADNSVAVEHNSDWKDYCPSFQ